jgi:hypothetical protein
MSVAASSRPYTMRPSAMRAAAGVKSLASELGLKTEMWEN